MEVTVTYDMDIESDCQALMRTIPELDQEDQDEEEREDDGRASMPSEEHRAVYEVVQANPRHALRVYHEALVEDSETLYNDLNGWNEERRDVRSKLWDLKDLGYVNNDTQLWYPVEAGD